MNQRDDDYVRGREFQNFREDVMRQFNEIKSMTSEQTKEFKKLIEEVRNQMQPLASEYYNRKEHDAQRSEDRRAVRNALIDSILKVGAGGALGMLLAWIGLTYK